MVTFLSKGGWVRVGVTDDKLSLAIPPPARPRLSQTKTPLLTAS